MTERYSFIYESSTRQKIRIFLVTIFVLIVIIALMITLIKTFNYAFPKSTFLNSIKESVKNEIVNFTPSGPGSSSP